MTCHNCQIACNRFGKHRNGLQRFRCSQCRKTFTEDHAQPLNDMRLPMDKAVSILKLLVEGMSIRSIERITEVHRDTIMRARKSPHLHPDGKVLPFDERFQQEAIAPESRDQPAFCVVQFRSGSRLASSHACHAIWHRRSRLEHQRTSGLKRMKDESETLCSNPLRFIDFWVYPVVR